MPQAGRRVRLPFLVVWCDWRQERPKARMGINQRQAWAHRLLRCTVGPPGIVQGQDRAQGRQRAHEKFSKFGKKFRENLAGILIPTPQGLRQDLHHRAGDPGTPSAASPRPAASQWPAAGPVRLTPMGPGRPDGRRTEHGARLARTGISVCTAPVQQLFSNCSATVQSLFSVCACCDHRQRLQAAPPPVRRH